MKHKPYVIASSKMIFTSFINKDTYTKVQTDAIYIDFKRAFSMVDHEILHNKIVINGIRGNLFDWF